jgi:hypothetical protein
MRIASVSDIHLDYKANRELFIKMAKGVSEDEVLRTRIGSSFGRQHTRAPFSPIST